MSSSYNNLKVLRGSGDSEQQTLSLERGEALRVLPGRREVFRASSMIDSQKRDVVVKRYLPHPKQARDWESDWQGLLRLQEMGLPAPKPLAVCGDGEGAVYVVMERLENAVTLGEFLKTSGCEDSQSILEKLAALVDSLHRSGACQSDQHIDNWAVSRGSIFLLDAGTFQFNEEPLKFEYRVGDLAAICVTLPPKAEQSFRRFLESHYWCDGGELRSETFRAFLESTIIELQQKRAGRYFKKSQRSCTEFEVMKRAGRSGMCARDADSELVENFFANPESLMGQGERLKSGNTCTVQGIEFAGKAYVLKRYNVKPWWTQLRRSLSPSRARLSWANSWVLNLAFIPTAKPVAFLDEGALPRGRSYFLMEAIEGELLPDFVERDAASAEKILSLIASVGAIWDSLGRLRAVHGDLKASNWMVDTTGQVFLFDMDSFRFGLSEAAFEAGRLKDMNRFLKNWQAEPELADAFRVRMERGERE